MGGGAGEFRSGHEGLPIVCFWTFSYTSLLITVDPGTCRFLAMNCHPMKNYTLVQVTGFTPPIIVAER